MRQKITNQIFGKTFFAALAFLALSIGAVNAQVCSIGTNNYATLDDAMATITDNTHTTIKLLANITIEGEFGLYDRNITFDLNGKDLIFAGVIGFEGYSVIDYTGAGNFKCIANIQTTGSGNGNIPIRVTDGSTLKLMSVEVNCTGGTNNSVCGILCDNSTVIINGDVKVTYSGNSAYGIDAEGNSTVMVNGSVTAADEGIYACNGDAGTVTVTVSGNVNAANGTGVAATGSTAVTIDGKINATDYIYLNGNAYTVANGVTDPAKPNYLKYADGTAIVWVKNSGTGIETVANDELRIYPNPVRDELRIESGELRIEKVEICDLSGKTVCQLDNLKNKIDVSALLQGIYIVKLKTDKGTATEKFIKE